MKKSLIGRSRCPDDDNEGGGEKQTSDEQFIERKIRKIKFDRKNAGKLSVVNGHARDVRIEFVAEGHYYKKEHGGKFRISVSGVKGYFFPSFMQDDSIQSKFQFPQKGEDGEYIRKNGRLIVGRSERARGYPPDYGLTRSECIAKQRESANIGTLVHAKAERYLELQLDPAMPVDRRIGYFLQKLDFDDHEFNIAKQVIDAEMQWIREGWTVFRTEWSVFNEDFNLAGQIDVVLKRMNGLAAEYAVIDWKTSKNPMTSCFSWKDFPNAFYPFHEYPATLANQYLMQEALYAHILVSKYGMNVVMLRAIGLHKDKRAGETKSWFKTAPGGGAGIPFAEVDEMLKIWKNFMEVERMIKAWEETGLTANGLFPTLSEPPFFIKTQGEKA